MFLVPVIVCVAILEEQEIKYKGPKHSMIVEVVICYVSFLQRPGGI